MYLLTGQAISDGTHRVQARGKDVIPMCLLGTFSPYVTVNQFSVVKIEPYISLEAAALVGCGVTTGWGSAVNIADVRPGETVIVAGVGGIGINAVQAAAAAGAERIIAIDPVEFHRDQAKRFGATHTFASMAEAIEPVMEITWGRMADKVMLAMGVVHGEDIEPAMILTAKAEGASSIGLASVTDMDTRLSRSSCPMLRSTCAARSSGGPTLARTSRHCFRCTTPAS